MIRNYVTEKEDSKLLRESRKKINKSMLMKQHSVLPSVWTCACVVLSLIILYQGYIFYSTLVIKSGTSSSKCPAVYIPKTRCFDEPINRLDQYCAAKSIQGQEGPAIELKDEWKLIYLALTIRHGDRSPIHSMPGSTPTPQAHSEKNLLDEEALDYAKRLSSFELKVLDPSQVPSDGENLRLALDPGHAFKTPDVGLSQGQLTSIGFMQHVRIGKILNYAYSDFLAQHIATPKDIFIRSTNYVRTIRSVAGLVSTLLPTLVTANSAVKIPIHYFQDEKAEVMHGVGTHSSSHTVSGHSKGEAVYEGACALSNALAKEQSKKFSTKKMVMDGLIATFGDNVTTKAIPELVDSCIPNLCHGQSLPCAQGTGNCLHRRELENMMAEADRFYCERYSGTAGGKNASNLSLYPFVNEIVSHLTAAARGSEEKIGIFSGHDTVIAPVLSAFGIYSSSRPDLCIWPHYASRIVFELYRKKSSRSFRQRRRTAAKVDDSSVAVRVLYNGLDVTHLIPSCRREMQDVSKTSFTRTLCTLTALNAQVQSIISPHNKITEACGMKAN